MAHKNKIVTKKTNNDLQCNIKTMEKNSDIRSFFPPVIIITNLYILINSTYPIGFPKNKSNIQPSIKYSHIFLNNTSSSNQNDRLILVTLFVIQLIFVLYPIQYYIVLYRSIQYYIIFCIFHRIYNIIQYYIVLYTYIARQYYIVLYSTIFF